jgi:hypothetical protein
MIKAAISIPSDLLKQSDSIVREKGDFLLSNPVNPV